MSGALPRQVCEVHALASIGMDTEESSKGEWFVQEKMIQEVKSVFCMEFY